MALQEQERLYKFSYKRRRDRIEPTNLIIHQYDMYDNEIRSFPASDLGKYINGNKYYFRVEPYLKARRERRTDFHFGVKVHNDGENTFDMGTYANKLLNWMIRYAQDGYYARFHPYYDNIRNMVYYFLNNVSFHYDRLDRLGKIPKGVVEKEIDSLLKKNPLMDEVFDINNLSGKRGLYLLVLGEYGVCYFGQSNDIKRRIQSHWSTFNPSTTGIDMFRALDTTKIYATYFNCEDQGRNCVTQEDLDAYEYLLIHLIDRRFLINKLGGGKSLEFINSDDPIFGYRPLEKT